MNNKFIKKVCACESIFPSMMLPPAKLKFDKIIGQFINSRCLRDGGVTRRMIRAERHRVRYIFSNIGAIIVFELIWSTELDNITVVVLGMPIFLFFVFSCFSISSPEDRVTTIERLMIRLKVRNWQEEKTREKIENRGDRFDSKERQNVPADALFDVFFLLFLFLSMRQ